MSVMNSFSLEGKVAVVTGGAGLYGRQIAESLAEAGAETWMASRNTDALQEQAGRFADQGLTVKVAELDQSKPESVDALRDRVVKESGQVDVLVNNAASRPMKSWDGTPEEFAASMAVNATGVWLMHQSFGNHMAEREQGSIINIGSIYGMVGPDFSLYEGLGWGSPPDYYHHKGGMIQLTRYAASYLGQFGVRVNCLSPGGFFYDQEAVFVERYNKKVMLGRMANDTDLKGSIVFLASDASAYITAANLPIDGGLTAK